MRIHDTHKAKPLRHAQKIMDLIYVLNCRYYNAVCIVIGIDTLQNSICVTSTFYIEAMITSALQDVFNLSIVISIK